MSEHDDQIELARLRGELEAALKRRDGAEAEVARCQSELAVVLRTDPCEKCGHGVRIECYGCENDRLRAALDARGPVEDREYTEAALALAEATLMEFSRGESEETAKAFDDALLRFVKACPNLTAQVREINEARRASKSRPVSLARGGEGGTK